jgi:hypothetical protein
MATKRKLKLQLAEAIFNLQIMRQDLNRAERVAWELKRDMAGTKEQLDEYRAKYELLYHSPEFKADTEEAFKRGSEKLRRALLAWVMDMESETSKWKVEDN